MAGRHLKKQLLFTDTPLEKKKRKKACLAPMGQKEGKTAFNPPRREMRKKAPLPSGKKKADRSF